MCFSAAASFTVAAATGAVGIASLRLVQQRNEIPLAFVPILFAGQQAIEGTLWLLLSGESADKGVIGALSLAFLIVAEVVWPIFVPIVVLLVEPERRRRLALKIIVVLGIVLSIDLFQALLNDLPVAAVRGHSIRYPGYIDHLSWQQSLYLLCTCASLLLSSHRMIQAIGAVIVIGLAVSAYAYYATLVSVWCFFAAADSTLLYFHFKRMGAVAQAQPNALGK
ncbi:MAG: DUF6629 family protein [Geminicoccaceae bacterium]